MSKTNLSIKKPTLTGNADGQKALDALARDDLDQVLKRLPLNVPEEYYRRLHMMRAGSDKPVKAFILEAIEDLFEKYDKGNGKYHIQN